MRSVHRILVALALAPVAGAAQSIDTLALEGHAAFLATDSLGGRANGSAGQRIAAEYLVGQLRRIGIPGAFAGGAYLQQLPLTRFDVDGRATRLIVRRDARADTIAASEFHHQGGAPEAFAAFRGAPVDFGTSIAAAGALSGAEVRGHVVAVTAARGGNLPALLDSLQARGASAAIIVLPDSQLYRRLRNARGASRFHVRAPLGSDNDRRMPVLLASPAAGRVLGVGAGVPGAGSAPAAPRRLRTVQLEVRVARRDIEAANVAGFLPGTDPSRRDEPIVLVAHYDHVGFAEPVDGDSLYNGFMDNAVGAATLLAAAEALRARPPARPVIFLLATAEEEGSRGSAYFVAHPPMPLARAAAVNVDLPAPLAPPKSWIFEGDSALGEAARRVAVARGWTAERGPAQPNSDHWSFLARGVPAVFVVPGERWEGVTAAQEQALIERWWRPHQPDDEWSADFPAAGLSRVAELVVALAREW